VALFHYQQHNIQVALQDLGAPEHQETVLLPTIAYVPGTTKFRETANYKKNHRHFIKK
jgi:hypothetical protein